MMARIAADVESSIEFKSYPASGDTNLQGLSKAVKAWAQTTNPKCIVVFSRNGSTALALAAERLKSPVFALTTDERLYHALNLVWGIRPLLMGKIVGTFEDLGRLTASVLEHRGLAAAGDRVLVVGEIPADERRGSNFISIHTMA
jgi:pyruvate kinase